VKIIFASIPAYGHLYPLMPLALACADAGHDVTLAVGPPFLDRLPLPTCRSSRSISTSTRRSPRHGAAIRAWRESN
jgi:hypothetical protein